MILKLKTRKKILLWPAGQEDLKGQDFDPSYNNQTCHRRILHVLFHLILTACWATQAKHRQGNWGKVHRYFLSQPQWSNSPQLFTHAKIQRHEQSLFWGTWINSFLRVEGHYFSYVVYKESQLARKYFSHRTAIHMASPQRCLSQPDPGWQPQSLKWDSRPNTPPREFEDREVNLLCFPENYNLWVMLKFSFWKTKQPSLALSKLHGRVINVENLFLT